jgi:hypothetical protein
VAILTASVFRKRHGVESVTAALLAHFVARFYAAVVSFRKKLHG